MPVDILNPNGVAIAVAERLTRTIPIVRHMGVTRRDASGAWTDGSLLPPNVTGAAVVPPEPLEPKMLALLKAIKPSISRVAFVGNPRHAAYLSESEVMVAARMDITLFVANIRSIDHPQADLDEALRQGAEGIVIYPGGGQFTEPQRLIAEWARRYRIPAIYLTSSDAADEGGLMALGAPGGAATDRLAYLIDRILRGAKPKDLPIEDPVDVELVINLGAAKAIGLEVPPALRLQAARLIE